jgi:hypothetical protein
VVGFRRQFGLQDHLEPVRGREVRALLVQAVEHRQVREENRLIAEDQHVVGIGLVLGSGRRSTNAQRQRSQSRCLQDVPTVHPPIACERHEMPLG